MANITAALVKELRERTQAGMMDCKKALMENDGDMDKAIDWLREKGLAQAAKKAGRIAAEGAVVQYITECGKVGAVVEVNCETDFVAKTDNFMNFANSVAKHVALANPADIDALNTQKFVDDETKTIADLLSEATVAIGEKVMEKLKGVDEVAYVRFASVYRQFKDINTFMEELNKLLDEKNEAYVV